MEMRVFAAPGPAAWREYGCSRFREYDVDVRSRTADDRIGTDIEIHIANNDRDAVFRGGMISMPLEIASAVAFLLLMSAEELLTNGRVVSSKPFRVTEPVIAGAELKQILLHLYTCAACGNEAFIQPVTFRVFSHPEPVWPEGAECEFCAGPMRPWEMSSNT